jgi:hypothetical protein
MRPRLSSFNSAISSSGVAIIPSDEVVFLWTLLSVLVPAEENNTHAFSTEIAIDLDWYRNGYNEWE